MTGNPRFFARVETYRREPDAIRAGVVRRGLARLYETTAAPAPFPWITLANLGEVTLRDMGPTAAGGRWELTCRHRAAWGTEDHEHRVQYPTRRQADYALEHPWDTCGACADLYRRWTTCPHGHLALAYVQTLYVDVADRAVYRVREVGESLDKAANPDARCLDCDLTLPPEHPLAVAAYEAAGSQDEWPERTHA